MIVGIIGGGQLARMLILAGYPLGLRFRVLDPASDACAGQVAELIQGDYDDSMGLDRLVAGADVVTYDFENVPVAAARRLQKHIPVLPPPDALEVAQDRLREKTLFDELGIAVPPFVSVDSLDDLVAAVTHIGLPAMLKTRRLGYDGKGQRLLRSRADIEPAWRALGGVPLILESFVPFEREVSILALRDLKGEVAFYPLVENRHRDGILRLSMVPGEIGNLQYRAQAYATRVMERLAYVGLLTIEFFVQEGRLVANEMAPRVHNSGHWTIEGAEISQFENHLRAILGWPLGSTAALGHSAMVNGIGQLPDRNTVMALLPNAHFHDYGKNPRPGRKIGHITLQTPNTDELHSQLAKLKPLIEGATL